MLYLKREDDGQGADPLPIKAYESERAFEDGDAPIAAFADPRHAHVFDSGFTMWALIQIDVNDLWGKLNDVADTADSALSDARDAKEAAGNLEEAVGELA